MRKKCFFTACLVVITMLMFVSAVSAKYESEYVFQSGIWFVVKSTNMKTDKVIYSVNVSTKTIGIRIDSESYFIMSSCILDNGDISFRIDKNRAIDFSCSLGNYRRMIIGRLGSTIAVMPDIENVIEQMKDGRILRVFVNTYGSNCETNVAEFDLTGFTKAYNKYKELTK